MRTRRRHESLIGQVIAANAVLVALTVVAAVLLGTLDLSDNEERSTLVALSLIVLLTFAVNVWMLQRRFAPLDDLIAQIEAVDASEPASFELAGGPTADIDRVAESFNDLLGRIEAERRHSAQLVLRAQEEERGRVARDLHDEVNQALTAILLRLQALGQDVPPEQRAEVTELKALAQQAMDQLLALARQLRPAALDDHGLVPAIEAQLAGLGERTGITPVLSARGDTATLGEEQKTVVYRVTQEALANAGRHAGAENIEVRLVVTDGHVELHVRDDGVGFDPVLRRGSGLGLDGMAERARLVGGELDLRSAPGAGTELTLRVP